MHLKWNKKAKKAFAIANAWNPIGWAYGTHKVAKHYKVDPAGLRKSIRNLFGIGNVNYSQYQNSASSYVPRTLSQLTGGH